MLMKDFVELDKVSIAKYFYVLHDAANVRRFCSPFR